MRVRDHVALSATGAALLRPQLGRDALGFLAGGVLIDADHYLWFCLRERRVSLRGAVRFFNGAQAPQHSATRVLHHPAALAAVLLVAMRRPRGLPFAAGMAVHVALDAFHETRMDHARKAALRRDGFSCQTCGTQGSHVGTHICQQPRLLPSYGTENLISLCDHCHEEAHNEPAELRSWS